MSLGWNILDKIFFQTEGSQRKDRKRCPSSGLHPCASFWERWDCGVEESINFADLPGWVGCEVWDEEVQSQADCEYSLDRI